MSEEVNDEGHLRKYLLGELPEAEQQALEERLMTEAELFDLLLVAEDELIEDYVDDTLSRDERGTVESFFLSMPDRRRKLSFAMTLRRYVTAEGAAEAPAAEPAAAKPSPQVLARPTSIIGSATWWNRAFSSPYLRMTVAAVVIFTVGFGIWRGAFYRSDAEKGLAALARAYPESPIEARISALNYPPKSRLRGAKEEKGDDVARDIAERFILDAVSDDPGEKSYHALGQLYLVEQKFVEAAKQFEKALQSEPNNAKLHNDYGAALLEIGKESQTKGEQGKSFEEFSQSNEHLSRAVELNDSLLEAFFNRALCHEYLRLYQQAEEDWNEYIHKDPNSKWTDEAREKLRELQERPRQTSRDGEQLFQDFVEAHRAKDETKAWKLISESRGPGGSLIENKLIDSYLDLAIGERKDEAKDKLDALSFAARIEYDRARDPFITNLVRFYNSGLPTQLETVSRARGLMEKARKRMSQNKFAKALRIVSEAKAAFESVGDEAETELAAYSAGNCYLQQSRAELALASFQRVSQGCEASQYRWLLSQTLCASANACLYLREFSAAIGNSERSMGLSKEIGDTKSYLRTFFQLAEEYRFVNKAPKALDLHVQDLFLTGSSFPQPAELWKNYFAIGLTLYQLDRPVSAIDFQKEALHLARAAGNPRVICRSYNYLGMLMARHGDYSEAAANLSRGLELGSSFTEREVRIEATAPSLLQLGYVYRKSGDFNRAVENYDRAIQAYDELNSTFFGYTARKEKLLCCMEQGACSSIEQEMETLLKLFEEHRSKIVEESNRASYFDAEQGIYDLAIEFEYVKKNNPKKAFEYSERSRGRSALDLINPGVEVVKISGAADATFREFSDPMSLEGIRGDMPPRTQLLQYAVLKDSIIIWVLTDEDGKDKDPFTASQSIATGVLEGKLKNFRDLIARGSEEDRDSFSREAASLYELLIKPVENVLDGRKSLCIVPDKMLNDLPFAALRSEASGKYFFERQDRGFVLSPSATMFIKSTKEASKKGAVSAERILSVGDPLFDRKAFSGLDVLTSTPREAKTVADFYGSFGPLTGASATKKRVMSEMERSDVIHLATHAIPDELYPLSSKMLLARAASRTLQEESDGCLRGHEILSLDLHRARLVVLSACRTGIDGYFAGEGMVGLSRAFIGNKVPLVVASLWEVETDSTADLMISFHRHRKRDGGTTAEALRSAQLDMLADSRGSRHQPSCWASFVAIGGYTDF